MHNFLWCDFAFFYRVCVIVFHMSRQRWLWKSERVSKHEDTVFCRFIFRSDVKLREIVDSLCLSRSHTITLSLSLSHPHPHTPPLFLPRIVSYPHTHENHNVPHTIALSHTQHPHTHKPTHTLTHSHPHFLPWFSLWTCGSHRTIFFLLVTALPRFL